MCPILPLPLDQICDVRDVRAMESRRVCRHDPGRPAGAPKRRFGATERAGNAPSDARPARPLSL
eukprot:350919-Chlamydomonas_euryale.AAC.3